MNLLDYRSKPGKEIDARTLALIIARVTKLFDPDQARDERGRWTSEGGASQVSWEAQPSTKTGYLRELHSAPYEKKAAYLHDVLAVLHEPGGDPLLKAAGIEGTEVEGVGYWEGAFNPGIQLELPPDTPKDAIEDYCAAMGLLLAQDAVAAHVIRDGGESQGAEVMLGRGPTKDELKAFHDALPAEHRESIALVYSKTGVRALNFSGLPDDEFLAVVQKAAGSIPEVLRLGRFRFDGVYVGNDWQGEPHGEGYRTRLGGSDRGAGLRREVERLLGRVAEAGRAYGTGEHPAKALARRLEELIAKHLPGLHDQAEHGNWATGGGKAEGEGPTYDPDKDEERPKAPRMGEEEYQSKLRTYNERSTALMKPAPQEEIDASQRRMDEATAKRDEEHALQNRIENERQTGLNALYDKMKETREAALAFAAANGIQMSFEGLDPKDTDPTTWTLEPQEGLSAEKLAEAQGLVDAARAAIGAEQEYQNETKRLLVPHQEAEQVAQAALDKESAAYMLLANGMVPEAARMAALGELGVDFATERMMRDDDLYSKTMSSIAEKWQHIGGDDVMKSRFAAGLAFDLDEGRAFDSKEGRFRDPEEFADPISKGEITAMAAAMRREYDETQHDIAEGVTFKTGTTPEDIDELLSSDAYYEWENEQRNEAWNGYSTSDKLSESGASEGKINEQAIEWADENPEKLDAYIKENEGVEPPSYASVLTMDEAIAKVKEAGDDPITLKVLEDNKSKYSDVGAMLDAMEARRDAIDGIVGTAEGPQHTMSAMMKNREAVGQDPISPSQVAILGRLAERLDTYAHDPGGTWAGRFAKIAGWSGAAMNDPQTVTAAKLLGQDKQFVFDLLSQANYIRADAKDNITRLLNIAKEEDLTEPQRERYYEKLDEFRDPYLRDAWANSEEGDQWLRERWDESGSFSPDSQEFLDQQNIESGGEETEIRPRDWPLTLYRGIRADTEQYVPNYAESWTYTESKTSQFGSHRMEEQIEPDRVLVFQGASNWQTPEGKNSMGNREDEFIVLPRPPYWVRNAAIRGLRAKLKDLRARREQMDKDDYERARKALDRAAQRYGLESLE